MYKDLSLLSRSPMFSVFCFVFKRFCLTFKVVHVHECISYVILLFACFPCLWLCLSV